MKPSKGLTQRIFQAEKFLSKSYKLSPMIWAEYSTNTQRSSISQNTLRYSKMRIIIKIWRSIGFQSRLKIGKLSRTLSKRPNMTFLTKKFKKLPIRIVVYKNSWTRSKSISFWQLKLFDTTIDHVSNSMIFGKPSIYLLIQH